MTHPLLPFEKICYIVLMRAQLCERNPASAIKKHFLSCFSICNRLRRIYVICPTPEEWGENRLFLRKTTVAQPYISSE